MSESNPLISRYAVCNSSEVIRRRTRLAVEPILDANTDTVEGACLRIKRAWKKTFVPTNAVVEIIRLQVECAQAHAAIYYRSPRSILEYGYADEIDADPYMPTCLTGLAGTGKSEIQHALVRLLGHQEVSVKLDGHKAIPLTTFTRVAVSGHKSISQIVRHLGRPEVANGTVRIPEPQLPLECARWQYLTGGCLFSADEMQFLAQSQNANAFVSQALQALSEVRIPWLFGANFSLCWKLRSRHPETTQRLLSRPVVLVPDAPSSTCWANVLDAYDRVVPGLYAFHFKDRRHELWNYTAGIKRELVLLLTHAYRLCRLRGSWETQWSDVERAYGSIEYSVSRTDVGLLISHAAQGGSLRQDLACPFVDENSNESIEAFRTQLRQARSTKVIAAAIDASMTVDERAALKRISDPPEAAQHPPNANVLKLRKKPKATISSLQEAGRRFKTEIEQ
tara:strand:+ start:498 stop:1850 length:1353 start_codon:yes stop_codon:yes gene_type:complete